MLNGIHIEIALRTRIGGAARLGREDNSWEVGLVGQGSNRDRQRVKSATMMPHGPDRLSVALYP